MAVRSIASKKGLADAIWADPATYVEISTVILGEGYKAVACDFRVEDQEMVLTFLSEDGQDKETYEIYDFEDLIGYMDYGSWEEEDENDHRSGKLKFCDVGSGDHESDMDHFTEIMLKELGEQEADAIQGILDQGFELQDCSSADGEVFAYFTMQDNGTMKEREVTIRDGYEFFADYFYR